MGRDTVQLETAVSTISQDYLLEFTSEYGISEALHLELPGPGERIVDFPKGKVIEMEDPTAATDSSGVLSTIERSHPDFANENPSQQSTGPEDQGQEAVAPEVPPLENATVTGVTPKREIPAAIGLEMGSTRPVPASRDLPRERPRSEIWNQRIPLLPPWSELRHLHNDDFLKQYNVNLARQVAMGSQLRLRFDQKAKPLKKSVAQFSDLQVSNNRLSQQVSALQAQVIGEENLKAAFKEFKQYEDNRELKYGVEHRKANLSLEAIEAYDPEAEAKYIAALHALKDLKYPIVDQLENLKDAPMDVIMASLHLESDTGDDAPHWIRELRPSSSQLTILVYPEARDPTDSWACKEEIFLADAEWYAVYTGSAPRITPSPMVFQYLCQPLLHKVLLSCWQMRLQKRKYLRTRPLP
nr:hypothetical protein [Tanacetum cinerariifolium]